MDAPATSTVEQAPCGPVQGWTFQPVEFYLGGTLPTLTVSKDTRRYRFLPCNPAKQASYPDFVGYLINVWTGEKFGINAVPSPHGRTRYVMRLCPVTLAEDLHLLLPRLMRAVRAYGHRFPGDPPPQ